MYMAEQKQIDEYQAILASGHKISSRGSPRRGGTQSSNKQGRNPPVGLKKSGRTENFKQYWEDGPHLM